MALADLKILAIGLGLAVFGIVAVIRRKAALEDDAGGTKISGAEAVALAIFGLCLASQLSAYTCWNYSAIRRRW